MQIPETAPFSEEQRAALNRLLPTVSPPQLQWLAGFITGLEASMQRPGPSPAEEPPSLSILFGSESGNAEGLAQQAKKEASRRGFRVTVADMADRSAADLARERNLLVITSTWGDGDPPDNAMALHAALMSPNAPSFAGVSFAVCALGDTSYDKFCQTGKDFDRRLAELGAERFHERMDCDLDYEAPFNQWLGGVLVALERRVIPETQGRNGDAAATDRKDEPKEAYGKKNPFPAPLTERILLSGRGSGKEVWHHELSLAGSGLTYEPGDSLAVVPRNREEDVNAILEAGQFSGESVTLDGSTAPLRHWLSGAFDCTTLTKNVAAKYNDRAQSAKLSALLADAGAMRDYLHGRQIVDLLTDFPVEGLPAESFLALLRRMPPRLYSIASSLRAYPEEVHLTVASVRYVTHGRSRAGVASTYLAERVALGDTVSVFVTPNKHFKLPADAAAPIIMVGPGTGVAPFRAFLQERQATGATGKNWLFFGDQHYTLDFLYQLEWQDYLKERLLTKLDVAFSRDQKEKIYVQHRMMEQASSLWRWMQDGAVFYVCGDASRMAGDVHEALIRIAEREGGLTRAAAEEHVEELRKSRRYLRDVY